MRSVFFSCVMLILTSAYTYASDAHIHQPVLNGKLTQGSLIRGKVEAGTQIWLNEKPVKVSSTGDFVIGFGRDATLKNVLKWQSPSMELPSKHLINLEKRIYKIDKIEGVAKKYVSPPQAVLARIRNDNAAVAKARQTNSDLNDFLSDLIMPAKGRISGVYGSQRYFNGEPKRPHFGLDIANKVGEPVVAPIGGIVTLAHADMYYSGGTLLIDHGFGVSSTFIHLSKIHVKEGQRVEQGELVAEIGATGRVTGPHLDWRINWFKERLDPALLLDTLE